MNEKWVMFWDKLRFGQKNTINKRQHKGRIGEVDVDSLLQFLDPDEYKVIHDGLFKLRDDITVQIDHIVVSRAGIFVIETKNYGGIITCNNDTWTQIWHKKHFNFYSPKHQNESHIKSLMYVLFTKRRDFFHSLVVFPEHADLMLDDTDGVVKLDSVCKYIQSKHRHIFTHDEMLRLYNQIVSKNIYSKENIKKHRARVEQRYG